MLPVFTAVGGGGGGADAGGAGAGAVGAGAGEYDGTLCIGNKFHRAPRVGTRRGGLSTRRTFSSSGVTWPRCPSSHLPLSVLSMIIFQPPLNPQSPS